MTSTEKEQLNKIATLLKDAGYDPYSQLQGYYETGDDSYITRNGDARKQIKLISRAALSEYIEEMPH